MAVQIEGGNVKIVSKSEAGVKKPDPESAKQFRAVEEATTSNPPAAAAPKTTAAETTGGAPTSGSGAPGGATGGSNMTAAEEVGLIHSFSAPTTALDEETGQQSTPAPKADLPASRSDLEEKRQQLAEAIRWTGRGSASPEALAQVEKLREEARQVDERLATIDTADEVITAIENGQTPQQAGIDAELFPDSYLTRVGYGDTNPSPETVRAEVEEFIYSTDLLNSTDETVYFSGGAPQEITPTRDAIYGEFIAEQYVDATEGDGDAEHLANLQREVEQRRFRPEFSTAFYNELGPERSANIARDYERIVLDNGNNGDAYGQSDAYFETYGEALGAASRAGGLDFTGSELVNAIPNSHYASHLFRGGQYDPQFVADAAAAYSVEGAPHEPLTPAYYLGANDARTTLFDAVSRSGPEAAHEFLQQASEAGALESMLTGYQGYHEGYASSLNEVIELATIDHHRNDPAGAEALAFDIVNAVTNADETVVEGLEPALGGIVALHADDFVFALNREPGAAVQNNPNRDGFEITHDQADRFMRAVAGHPDGTAKMVVGLELYAEQRFSEALAAGDEASLNRALDDVGTLAGALVEQHAESEIGDGQDADRQRAAVVGALNDLAAYVPIPGSGAVGKVAGKVYSEISSATIDSVVPGGSAEGQARADAEAFYQSVSTGVEDTFIGIAASFNAPETRAEVNSFMEEFGYPPEANFLQDNGAPLSRSNMTPEQREAYEHWRNESSDFVGTLLDEIVQFKSAFADQISQYDGP